MARIHVYADESGNFDFSRGPGATRYFILTSVTFFDDRQARAELDELRYELAWGGATSIGTFHASEDRQYVRDRVFEVLAPHRFRVDATILEKAKVLPYVRETDERFFRYVWYYHTRHVVPAISPADSELLVATASIGTKKRHVSFHSAVADVVAQVSPDQVVRTVHWPAPSDAGLQIADYCSWAIFRKWEHQDERSHRLIADKIATEHDLLRDSAPVYY